MMKKTYLAVAISIAIFAILPLSTYILAQGAEGKIIAHIDFDPGRDGFSFRNYGGNHDGSEDLDAADMISIFGAENVCIEGSTAADCVLYETADQWREEQIKGMEGGHCDGFSVTTMRNWLELPFRGKIQPKQWQSGAEDPFGLKFDHNLANYIAHYHILQNLEEVYTFRVKTFKMPPSTIVKLLVDSFQNKKEFYTLGIGMRVDGKYTRGHSILPTAIEEMSDGVYRIHVYDNNFPGQTKYVTVDGNAQTWRYRTASDPNDVARDYVGSLKTETLSLKKMSDRNLARYECPFCEETSSDDGKSGGGERSPHSTPQIEFSLSGEGDLLISDQNGKQIGYDFKKKAEVNQVPGGEIIYDDGGLDMNLSPAYALPYSKTAKKPYQVLISGKDLAKEVDADLDVTGPGFVVGFENISLDPKEELNVAISPDGRTLTFTASADGETPTIYITTADGPNKPSYSFDIGGVALEAGKTLTVSVDIKAGKVSVKDNDGKKLGFKIHIERENGDGTKIKFDANTLSMKVGDNFEVDFSKWTKDHPPCVEDDGKDCN